MKTKSHRRTFLKQGVLLGGGLFLLGPKVARAAETNSAVAPASSSATENPPAATVNIWEVFQHRRSVRKFRPDTIPEKDIVKIIDAARLAPTSGNQQPWKFLVVRDKDKIARMKEACVKASVDRVFGENKQKEETREQWENKVRRRLDGYFSAPVYIVVLTDNHSKYADYNHWDGPLAGGFLTLAARALGYGTVFITDAIPDSVTRSVLRIPDNYTRVCITPLGIPVEWPNSPQKKGIEEFLAYESLGQ
jgi:nitroreductase